MTIHVVVDVDVEPARLDVAAAAFHDLATVTLAEPGCHRFDVFVAEEEADRIVLVETWADQAAIDAHMEQEYTARFLAESGAFLAGAPRARRLRPVPATT